MRRLLFFTMIAMCSFSANAQTRAEVERELHRIGIPHADIVLAQARLETGNFKSRRCREDHNLFGIKHEGKYAKYRNWRESVSDYKRCISNRYSSGDYYGFLARIGYAKDKAYKAKLQNIVRTSKKQ